MNIIITGRTGFIAQHLIVQLQFEGHTVLGSYSGIESYCPGTIDAIVHLSAQAGIRPEKQNAITQYECNVMKTIHLLELCVKYKVRKFIFVSSSSVYGNPVLAPVKETDATNCPLCHYAATKKSGELACYTYHHLYGIDVAVLRPFTVYGPGQKSNMAIPVFTKLIHEGKTVTVFGSGGIQRDYVYVQDVVNGIVGALGIDHRYEEYNIGSGVPTSILDVILAIEDELQKKADIQYIPIPEGEALTNYANISKATNAFGYYPKYTFRRGLAEYIDWFKKEE